MELHEIEALVREAVRDADLHPNEIPAIDLYVDQITSLTSDKLKEGADRFHDRVLTKTMINNYSKDGLISPIQGKKYSKEQFLQMLVVYSLKNTLSIGEIKRILQNVYEFPEYDEKMLESVYMRYLDIKEFERGHIWDELSAFIQKTDLNIAQNADYLTLILGLACMSSYFKNAAQALLEARYPDLNADRALEEQEKREEAKRQKVEKKEEKKEKKKAAKSKAEAEPRAEGEEL